MVENASVRPGSARVDRGAELPPEKVAAYARRHRVSYTEARRALSARAEAVARRVGVSR